MFDQFKSENTRRYKRLKAAYLLAYETGIKGELPRMTNTKNISAGGVKFLTREAIPESSTIRVNMLVPSLERNFKAQARIIRMRKLKKKPIYSVAAEFVDMGQKDTKTLNDFIEELAASPDAGYFIDDGKVVRRRKGPGPSAS